MNGATLLYKLKQLSEEQLSKLEILTEHTNKGRDRKDIFCSVSHIEILQLNEDYQ